VADDTNGLATFGPRAVGAKVQGVVDAGAFPVIIGGDHSITWPAATAVARKHGWGRLVHLDAHADTAGTVEGNLASQGTPMRRRTSSPGCASRR
jgi:arginase family enzyme